MTWVLLRFRPVEDRLLARCWPERQRIMALARRLREVRDLDGVGTRAGDDVHRAADVMYESALARLRDVMCFDLGFDWEPEVAR